jgi:hypothetical protein
MPIFKVVFTEKEVRNRVQGKLRVFGFHLLKSKGGRMKKLFSVLVGLLLISALASAHLIVGTAKSGTQEYFGITRVIAPGGIYWKTGAVYKSGDYLKFYFTAGSGFTFKATNSTFYYLVGRSRGDNNLYADLNVNGTNEWGQVLGGGGQEYVTFRITDAYTPFMNPLTTWFLTTVTSPGATPGLIYVSTPAPPAASATGTAHKLYVDVIDGINNLVLFDGTPASATFFTNWFEFVGTLTAVNSTIDVNLQRKGFTVAPVYRSGGNNIVTTQTAQDYSTATAGGVTATDYFTHTVTGDMTGISYAKFYGTTKTPGASNVVVAVPGLPQGAGNLTFPAAGSAVIVVNGTTALNNRVLTDAYAFVPASPGSGFYGRSLYGATTGWTWDTNGTVFRSVWMTTATLDGNYSAFRFANHAALGTPDAQVFAEIWLDDGTHTDAAHLLIPVGVIPAMGHLSIRADEAAVNNGLAPATTMAASGAWKGRVVFTIWSPAPTTFGTELQIMGGGYTEISLEKQMNAGGVAWWEK